MAKIPRLFYRAVTQILFYIGLPAFYISFVLLYEPVWMIEFFTIGSLLTPVNIVIVAAIQLAVIALSRNLMFILRKHLNLNWLNYFFWCLAEVIVTGLFMGLFMSLISNKQYLYFSAVGSSLATLLLIWCYPYAVFSLVLALAGHRTQIEEEKLIRFHDSTQRLKCVIAADSILYVEADENYVVIRYLDGETIREYQLRNSMKAIEPLMLRYGMVRCQRSYYINPKHVRVLRRDKEGMIQAELDVKTRSIPVSPRYYEELSRLL